MFSTQIQIFLSEANEINEIHPISPMKCHFTCSHDL